MSIKPIDYQITYNNTVNEAKDKQNQLNKTKDSHYFAENQQNSEIQRNKSKIQDTEGASGKSINKDNHSSKENRHSKNKQRKKNSSKDKDINKDNMKHVENKGFKIDIFI
ncbi:MAG: hypothetical protein JJT76_05250 [Clostridiaceae bacterium]|nr:hypothetical protein [Clostridiaceae bacterium]